MEPWARKQRCPKKVQFLVEIFLPWQVPIRQKSPGGPRWGPNSGDVGNLEVSVRFHDVEI